MTLVAVAWKYLLGRVMTSALTGLAVALGVALLMATFLLTRGIRDSFIAGTTDYNLIVGAKGSSTQLVMNAIFRIDVPPPNIPYTVFERLTADRRVEAAVPLALGDAYAGFRYVATTPLYFQSFPWKRQVLTLADGRFLHDDPPDQPRFEALLGWAVAKQTGLRLGDRFYEGEEMAAFPLTVVGILRPTSGADDRTIFMSLASFWEMNELSREMAVKPLTAVLVRPKRLSDIPSLHREYNVLPDTQAVLPSAVLLTVFKLLGLAEEVLHIVLGIVALVVFLYLFVSMYHAALERKREIATMRALGARRTTIFSIIVLESCGITLAGGIVGLLGGYGVAWLGARVIAERGGLALNPMMVTPMHLAVLAGVMLLGALAGLLPALLAYRTEVADNLTPLS
ncbi:MAG TPA: ABC transporter permease [Alphaproteobacteria bacterium]|nr:ABC transporter permease [Alphaproteobacteria bacterium]